MLSEFLDGFRRTNQIVVPFIHGPMGSFNASERGARILENLGQSNYDQCEHACLLLCWNGVVVMPYAATRILAIIASVAVVA